MGSERNVESADKSGGESWFRSSYFSDACLIGLLSYHDADGIHPGPVSWIFSQTPVPPTPTPKITEIIRSSFCESQSIICGLWDTYRWLAYLIIIIVVLGSFLFYFWGPDGKNRRDWLVGIWNRLRRVPKMPPETDTPTFETLLSPLGPNEEKRFVTLSLFLPPKGGQQEYRPTDLSFDSLSEALEVTNPESELNQPFAKLALLGDPGSGKTWLLRMHAKEAVQKCLSDPSAPVPLLVSLSNPGAGSPIEFLRSQWSRFWPQNPHGLTFDQAFGQGRLLLLADGLNEVNRKQKHDLISNWRRFLSDHFSADGNRVIIACRFADFRGVLPIHRLIIRPLEPGRIQDYLRNRIPTTAGRVWDEIDKDRKNGRGDLLRLAENPFWLDKMAALAERQGFPKSRALLAEEFIQCRLDEEHAKFPELTLGEGWQPYLDALSWLAWKGLWRSQNYHYSMPEAKQTLASCKYLSPGSENRFLELMIASQLLEEVDGEVRFHHQLFQEYFAARRLAGFYQRTNGNLTIPHRKRLERRLWRTPWRQVDYEYSRWDSLEPPPRPVWAEATILAVGLVAEQPELLMLAVLTQNPTLAGECVHQSGIEVTDDIRGRVQQRLELLIERPPRWILLLAGWARFGLKLGKRFLPTSWQDRLQAWRLLPTSIRLGASRQLGYFDDLPDLIQRRGSLVRPGKKPVAFIEPAWLEIPSGEFRMGSSPRDEILLLFQNSKAFADEKPFYTVNLAGYKIGRTPVTVAEYRCFLDDGGYQQETWWLEGAALRWLNGELDFKESYAYFRYIQERQVQERYRDWFAKLVARGEEDPAGLTNLDRRLSLSEADLEAEWLRLEMQRRNPDQHAVKPWLWDEPGYDHPCQPVVGICWYEAQAYCAWLNVRLHEKGRIPADWKLRLPSEAQWEKAARGADGRLYPWGNHWNPNRCNSQESRVFSPSPVIMYPDGASPYGALDMVGNVWEWCRDWYDPQAYQKRQGREVVDPGGPESGTARAVRGGSWVSARNVARCAYRDGDDPDLFNNSLGFRVMLSPI